MSDTERLMTMKEACQFLHVSVPTLRRWEKDGTVIPLRTKGGQRRYRKEDLLPLVGASIIKKPRKITIGYCRVSFSGQAEDLERQVQVVTRFCEREGYACRIIKDIGSGLNYDKRGFKDLVNAVCTGETERVVVNYKDRLMRFG